MCHTEGEVPTHTAVVEVTAKRGKRRRNPHRNRAFSAFPTTTAATTAPTPPRRGVLRKNLRRRWLTAPRALRLRLPSLIKHPALVVEISASVLRLDRPAERNVIHEAVPCWWRPKGAREGEDGGG